MATKLYVGGLPYATTDDQLKDHFSAAGNVASAQIIMDKFSGRSKGFGFVEMASDEEAQKLLKCSMAKTLVEETSLSMKPDPKPTAHGAAVAVVSEADAVAVEETTTKSNTKPRS